MLALFAMNIVPELVANQPGPFSSKGNGAFYVVKQIRAFLRYGVSSDINIVLKFGLSQLMNLAVCEI